MGGPEAAQRRERGEDQVHRHYPRQQVLEENSHRSLMGCPKDAGVFLLQVQLHPDRRQAEARDEGIGRHRPKDTRRHLVRPT